MSAPGSPGRPRPRWSSQVKTSAMKDIEMWAREGREQSNLELARNSGQLSDNVTEERLLHARLWDLSKERFRFLSQVEYERRAFLDRQRRKNARFREPALEEAALRHRSQSRDLMRRESFPSSLPLDKLCESSVADHVTSVDLAESRAGTETVLEIRKSASTRASGQNRNCVFHTEPDHPIRPKASVSRGPQRYGSTKSTPAIKVSFDVSGTSTSGARGSLRRRAASAAVRPVQDPRYVLLERCLCRNWSGQGTLPELAVVINTNKSLHQPPKTIKDTKARTAMKIRRLIAEQGLAW